MKMKCSICDFDQVQFSTFSRDYEYQTLPNQFEFYSCPKCEHVFLKDPPPIELLPVIYPEDKYLPYQFQSALNPLVKKARNFVQRLKINSYAKLTKNQAHVLEIGCGSGQLMQSMAELGPRDWKLYANDFSDKKLKFLAAEGVQLLIGNIEKIEIQQKFDLIIMNQLLEHVYDPLALLNRCRELLNSGGAIVIETPNVDSLDYLLFKDQFWGGYHTPRHFHLFSPKTMTRMAGEAQLQVKEISYMLSPSFWIQSLHHKSFERSGNSSRFFSVNNLLLLCFFSGLDFILARVWKTSNMRVIIENSMRSQEKV